MMDSCLECEQPCDQSSAGYCKPAICYGCDLSTMVWRIHGGVPLCVMCIRMIAFIEFELIIANPTLRVPGTTLLRLMMTMIIARENNDNELGNLVGRVIPVVLTSLTTAGPGESQYNTLVELVRSIATYDSTDNIVTNLNTLLRLTKPIC